jgi:hypothetical protein
LNLTTWQSGHPPGDSVTHLNLDTTSRRPPGRRHQCASFGLEGAVSPVPPLAIERWEGGWGEEDGGPLTGVAWVVVVVGGLRWVF